MTAIITGIGIGGVNQTTVGSISTGTWEATEIGLAYGGTGANLTASEGGIFYSTVSTGAILAATATAGQILMSGASSAPSWSTATYPAATTAHQLLYSSSADTIAGLSTVDSGVLVAGPTGAPVWSSTMTNGQLIIGSTGGTPTASTLTAGSGVIITNSSGSITISSSGGTGTVTNVSGTSGEIDVANGSSTPVISIDSGYAGQTSITTLGDIATGTWEADVIGVDYGGTGLGSTVNSAVFITDQTGVPSWSSTMTDGQLIIGYTSGMPNTATLTEGPGISITNGGGSITISIPDVFVAPGSIEATTYVEATTNLLLPTTTSTAGQLQIDSIAALHAYGTENIFVGSEAGNFSLTGARNSTLGVLSLSLAEDNNDNVIIGYDAGSSYTSDESSNILIGSSVTGTATESNVLRIGSGTGDTEPGNLSIAYICGIYGSLATGGMPVYVTSSDLLGTVSSSKEFKQNITDMDDRSSKILELRPVNFSWKEDATNSLQWGLIAEEVAEIMPEMVNYNDEGKPIAVRYHDMPAVLLNEFKKLNNMFLNLSRHVIDLDNIIIGLKSKVYG